MPNKIEYSRSTQACHMRKKGAIKELKRCAGIQFDPVLVVESFLLLIYF